MKLNNSTKTIAIFLLGMAILVGVCSCNENTRYPTPYNTKDYLQNRMDNSEGIVMMYLDSATFYQVSNPAKSRLYDSLMNDEMWNLDEYCNVENIRRQKH